MSAGTQAAEPKAETPVAGAVRALEDSVRELALRIEALEEILKPVLSSKPEEPSTAEGSNLPSCQLEGTLRSLEGHITAMDVKLVEINSRIQL